MTAIFKTTYSGLCCCRMCLNGTSIEFSKDYANARMY